MDNLKEIIESLDGWCSLEKANLMHNLVLENKPNLIVELGVYGGRSLVPMALAQLENGVGIIKGIDPWSVDASLEGNHTVQSIGGWKGVNYSYIYERCSKAIIDYKLTNCELLRMKSQEAINLFDDNSIDILHQDGNHSEELTCMEVELYMPKLKSGGYWISDDVNFDTIKKSLGLIEQYCDLIPHNANTPFAVYKKR
jgi:cephalosporin hydroxylase